MIDRRQFFKYTLLGAASASGAALLGSCSSNADDGSTADSGSSASQVVVAMSTGSEPSAGFDPCVSWGCGEHVHEPLIQSTLIATDSDLEFVNDLATSYECSDDGLTWTFNIRDDVCFTDGAALTASDVAFTINTINNSVNSEADLSSVEEAVATSDTCVELRMAQPNNALLYTLAVLGIVPEHAYDESYGSNPIGSGRYMLEQWNQGEQAIFVANPDYYGDAPTMERVVVMFMEEDAALAAAQSGDVDIAYTSAVLADSLPSGYELLNCTSVDSRGISLPMPASGADRRTGMDGAEHDVGNDVTCNKALRQAVNYAVDRESMIDEVLNGYGTVAYSVGDSLPWATADMEVEYDPDKARDLLADDGWTEGSDGILEKDGVRASFDLLYPASDSVRQALAVAFSNQMAEIGIEVQVQGGDWDTDLYPQEFTAPILWGWGSNSPVELYQINHSEGWANASCYESETTDDLLVQALAAPTIEDSYEYYQRAQWDDETQSGPAPQGEASWVWLANIDHLYFKREGLEVADQKPHPHGHGWSLVNNVDRWSWA